VSTAPVAPPSDSQAIPAYKPRKSVKAPAVKTAVLIRRASGISKSQIARDLGITRPTVNRIIEESDLDRQIEAGRQQSATLIPKALRVADMRLEKGSETMAIEVLRQSIWPLNTKQIKAHDVGLTLAIQNLMGNVTVQGPQSQPVQADSKAIDLQPISAASAENPQASSTPLSDNLPQKQ